MDRRTFVSSLAVGGTASLAGCRDRFDTGGGGGDSALPRLSVDGRWLVDPSGERVVPRGVNVVDPWWGTRYPDVHGIDYWDTLRRATATDRGWHTHIVRVPLQPRTVRNVGLDAVVTEYLDKAVEITRRRGVYVILDYHPVERYDTADVDRRVRQFWRRVAPRYADESHVLYELFNEPTKPSEDSLQTWRQWRETAQPWVDIVRRNAPETPLIVGSPRWSSLAKYAPQDPFEGDDLLYSAHIFPSWGQNAWEAEFGAPARDVPLFITEWGYVAVEVKHWAAYMQATTSDWAVSFRDWVDDHENVGWTAWCFSSEWAPPMFDHDWNLMGGNEYMGEFTRHWLSEKRGDHWPIDGARSTDAGTRSETPSGTAPAPPSDVTVERAGPTAIRLTWTAGEDPVVGYRVTLNDAVIRAVDGDRRAQTVDGLQAATTYDVTVSAVDGRGRVSAPSEPITATTADPTAVAAELPRVDAAPAIDGRADGVWTDVEARPLEWTLVGTPGRGLRAEWRACWNDEALYVHASVTDDEASDDSEDPWNDDSVEVYLDADHSRAASYDGSDDVQLVVERGGSTVSPGPNSIPVPDGVRVGGRETDAGWTAELSVPWSPLGVSPAAGDAVGFDVHVNDDDDGSDRERKIAWFATVDQAWENPRLLSTVELTA